MTLIFETVRKISPRYQAVLFQKGMGVEVATWINSMTHYGAAAGWNTLVIFGLSSNDSRDEVQAGSYILLSEQTGLLEVLSPEQFKKQYTSEVEV